MAGAGIPSIAEIQSAVAAEFEIPVAWMREPCGTNGTQQALVARPRQAAMALSWMLTDLSGPRIGHFFGGRDHTTVLHARRAVAKRRKSDPRLDRRLKRITLELVRGGL